MTLVAPHGYTMGKGGWKGINPNKPNFNSFN